MNGMRSGLVIVVLAAAGLLLLMPGAQAASVTVESRPAPAYALSQDFAQLTGGAALRHEPRLDAWYAARGGQVASVMPRGGDGQAQAPMRHEFEWIPLLLVGGLLAIGVGAYLLHAARRPA
jgi:flagellar basal body-associated protein FliL